MAGAEKNAVTHDVKVALVGRGPRFQHLYRKSPEFHHAINALAGAAPFLLEALAESAEQAESLRRMTHDQYGQGPIPDVTEEH